MAACAVHFCSPHAAKYTLKPEPQWHKPTISRVEHASFDSGGDAHSDRGLSFQDAGFMSTQKTHVIGHARKLELPLWVMSNKKLRRVLLYVWERRARIQGKGSERERLKAAHQKLLEKIPHLLERMDNLCHQFCGCDDLARKRMLGSQIMNVDATIRNLRRGPALTVAILVFYFRRGMDSVGVAEELHTTSTYIRQTVHRVLHAAERMEAGLPAFVVRKVNEPEPGRRTWSAASHANHAATWARKRAERLELVAAKQKRPANEPLGEAQFN